MQDNMGHILLVYFAQCFILVVGDALKCDTVSVVDGHLLCSYYVIQNDNTEVIN